MKIVITTPLFPPETGDTALYSYELASRLKERHEVRVVTYGNNISPLEGVSIHVVNKQQPRLKRIRAMKKLLKEVAKGADIIYSQKAVAAGLPAHQVAKKLHIPHIVHLPHDEVWERLRARHATVDGELSEAALTHATLYEKMLGRAQKKVLRGAHTILMPTERHRRIFCGRYSLKEAQCTVLPSPAHAYVSLPFPPAARGRIILVPPFARTRELAGELQMLDALRKDHAGLDLVLLNTPCNEQETQMQHITCLAHPTRAELTYLAEEADALVLLDGDFADQEALADYLTMRVPIIASETSLAAELFGLSVITPFEPTSPDSLREALESLLAPDSARRSIVRDAARTVLQERYSWDAHIAALEELFTQTTS